MEEHHVDDHVLHVADGRRGVPQAIAEILEPGERRVGVIEVIGSRDNRALQGHEATEAFLGGAGDRLLVDDRRSQAGDSIDRPFRVDDSLFRLDDGAAELGCTILHRGGVVDVGGRSGNPADERLDIVEDRRRGVDLRHPHGEVLVESIENGQ